jgi:uncharacterized protein (TIGR02145 family)
LDGKNILTNSPKFLTKLFFFLHCKKLKHSEILMKTTLKSFAFAGAVLGGVLALSACGDDVTKVYQTTEENSGMEIAGSADDFDDCDSASIGKMMFASDENAAYICADSGWTPLSEKALDGKDGASCTVETLKDSSGYKIVCGEDSVGVVLNGKAGAKGAKGEDGKAGAAGENGTSCSVEMLTDSTGYKVVCGEDSVGVILNGLDGNGCSLKDNGNGTLSQVCGETTVTLYKALCGNVPYDPTKSFCYADSLYSCGETAYDPSKVFCDDRDSSVYGYVQIGTQTWMAENLNYNYNEGTAKSYCYNNDTANCTTYGRLYTWATAKDACPDGWHLPSSDEWTALETYVSENSSGGVGYALKSKSGWYNNGNGSDAFGFGALPAGYHDCYGTFNNVQSSAYFWSSTEYSADDAYYRTLRYYDTDLRTYSNDKNDARSVRCVKD